MATLYEPQAGDIYVMWGSSLISRIIRWLQKAVFGAKKAPSHAQVVVNAEVAISAGKGGVRYVTTSAANYHGDVAVMRPKLYEVGPYRELNENEQRKIKEVAGLYYGRGYDYFNYLIWIGRAAILPIALALGFLWPLFGWWGRGGMVGLILFLSIANPIHKWLKKEQTNHWHCSELVGQMMEHVGVSFGVADTNYLAPLHIWQVAKVCPERWDIFYLKAGKYIDDPEA